MLYLGPTNRNRDTEILPKFYYAVFTISASYSVKISISRFTIVSREAKKKQAIHDERVSYLHVALL